MCRRRAEPCLDLTVKAAAVAEAKSSIDTVAHAKRRYVGVGAKGSGPGWRLHLVSQCYNQIFAILRADLGGGWGGGGGGG